MSSDPAHIGLHHICLPSDKSVSKRIGGSSIWIGCSRSATPSLRSSERFSLARLASVRHQNGQTCALQYFARRSPEQNLSHTATRVGTHDDHRGTLLGCD